MNEKQNLIFLTEFFLSGNENNFITLAECEIVCRGKKKVFEFEFENEKIEFSVAGVEFETNVGSPVAVEEDRTNIRLQQPTNPCILPLTIGQGSSPQIRYYYDSQTQQCQSFTFMGKKFQTFSQISNFEFRFFNSKISDLFGIKTEFFLFFSGNFGNQNNFVSLAQCQEACGTRKFQFFF